MADSQLLVIVAVAMVAGVILFRLYTVLGRRTGHERDPQEGYRRLGASPPDQPRDAVVALPDRSRPRAEASPLPAADPVAKGLVDIKLADRHFETEHFLGGAKKAHEMIVTAFASGDRGQLRPLLSDEVFTAFESAIKAREDRHEKLKYTLVGYRDVRITHAELKGRTAEIELNYSVQFISSTTDAAGTQIAGDPALVRDVSDIWTFARDVRGSDPNWTLVATSGGEV